MDPNLNPITGLQTAAPTPTAPIVPAQPAQPMTPIPPVPTQEWTPSVPQPSDPIVPAQPQQWTPSVPQPPLPPDVAAPLLPSQQPLSQGAVPPPPDTIAQIAAQAPTTPISTNEVYATICSQIIKEQGRIIGALAYEQASHVTGLTIDPTTYACTIIGDSNKVIGDLVEQYRDFFGNAAVEVCREAAARFVSRLPNERLPEALKVL